MKLTTLEKKYIKKLMGTYYNCINAMSFQPTTKHYRKKINAKISSMEKAYEIPFRRPKFA